MVHMVIGRFEGQEPLAKAVESGNLNIVRNLIARGAHVSHEDTNGDTALHLLNYSKDSCLAIARLLIRTLEDVEKLNVRNHLGQTPLHLAALNGHQAVTLFFIDQGASGILQESMGYTPLYTALTQFSKIGDRGHVRVGDPWTTVLALVKQKHEEKYGVASNIPDSSGISPLNYLIRQNGIKEIMLMELILLLLKFNTDPSAVFPNNANVKEPLMEAFKLHKDSIVLVLLRNGAKIDVRDPWGGTLLHSLLRRPVMRQIDVKYMEILYLYKVNINATDNMGHTALHYSSLYGLDKAVQFLLNVNGHIYAEDIHGMTPRNLSRVSTTINILDRAARHASKRIEMIMMSRDERTYGPLALLDLELIHSVIEELYGMPSSTFTKEQESKYSTNRLKRIRDKIHRVNISKSDIWLSSPPILDEKVAEDKIEDDEGDDLLSREDNFFSSDSE